jgi:glyoxylase-like metal-dependent hydrolase (beta-lactamase superfamily II)
MLSLGSFAQSKLKVQVFTSDPTTLQTTSTLIEGAHFLLLVNAGPTQTDAAKLVDKIKATGKTLMGIFITSSSPQDYFGLNTLKAAFPHAKVWSIPTVITGINAQYANDITAWKPILGDKEVPDHAIQIFPAPAASILVDNEQVDIGGPIQGSTEGCAYLFIPTSKTLIVGDLAYANVHPWTAGLTADQRKSWMESLDKLKKMAALVVIAGHKDPNAADDNASVDQTTNYLRIYDKAVKTAHSSDELIGIMDDQFPDLKGLDTALKVAAAKQFPDTGQ